MKRRMKLLALLGVLSVIPALSSPAAEQAKPLKVLSYNILNGMKLDESPGKVAFTSWLRKVDPDILALQ
jgi:exodeoxyribonuclease-3